MNNFNDNLDELRKNQKDKLDKMIENNDDKFFLSERKVRGTDNKSLIKSLKKQKNIYSLISFVLGIFVSLFLVLPINKGYQYNIRNKESRKYLKKIYILKKKNEHINKKYKKLLKVFEKNNK